MSKASPGTSWWKEAIFYEIYPRSFRDTNGDGKGDLRGIIEKLDYVKALGVNALWLTPIFSSPWLDSGYDISDYDGIDPSMGTMDDFEELVAEAHQRGLRLILDLVINHTSDQHPWFRESRSSRDSPKRDFYIWRPPQDGEEPNNWKSLVKGSAWELDESSGEYYLHLFSKQQPDLNWTSPQVKQAVFAMMRRWLERGVDGYRMDVINCLMKPVGLPNAVRAPEDREKYVLDRTLYADNPGMHELLREMRRDVLAPYGAVAIGEVHFNTRERASSYVAPAGNELDLIFLTDLLFDRSGPGSIRYSIERWDEVLRGRGWSGFSLGNHDTPRQVSAIGDDGVFRSESAKALATLAFTAPGSPFVFQGDELGMTNVSLAGMDDYRDIEMKSFFEEAIAAGADPGVTFRFLKPRSRDNARTPMQWSPDANAGFTAGVPWLALNPNYTEINVADQSADADSVLQYYRRLAAFRAEHACLVEGDFIAVVTDEPALVAYRRSSGRDGLLVLLNLSSQPIDLALELAAGWRLFGNYPEPDAEPERLRPWEARITDQPGR